MTAPEPLMTEAEWAELRANQTGWARRLADAVEAGEPLERRPDRALIAYALRDWADNFPQRQPRKRGHQPEFDPREVCDSFIALTGEGTSENAAREQLAERYDVSVEAIRGVLVKHKAYIEQVRDLFGDLPSK